MPRATEPRPKFQRYVACRHTYYDEQEVYRGILVARAGRFHRTHGLQAVPICGMMQTGDVQLLHAVLRMPASGSVLAQADTLLGIVVKAEQLLKRQKSEAPSQ